jgi:hypothetical protein
LGVRFPAAAALLLVAACTSAPRRGNTVILASGADLQSANPLLTTHPLARQVQRYALLVTLVRYDSALTMAPYLARRWEWSARGDEATLHPTADSAGTMASRPRRATRRGPSMPPAIPAPAIPAARTWQPWWQR